MYRNRDVNGIHLRRILIRVVNRLRDVSNDEEAFDHILDDSDYEPSELGELEIIDLNASDFAESQSNALSQKEKASLGFAVTKKKNHNVVECCICLETLSFRQHSRTLQCNHLFHKKCIDKWFDRDRRCPVCRAEAIENRPIVNFRPRTRSSVAS